MDNHVLLDTLVFIIYFLAITSLISSLTKRIALPFTVLLLFIGFLTSFMLGVLGVEYHLTPSSDFIYFVLLPLLLFDSAMKLNLHQFSLQFKTITFLSSFGLLVSMFIIGAIVTVLLDIPFVVALLFGALISATDLVAVIALFKQLGAPNRLKILAEGEGMFQDATAVFAFRVVLGIVTAEYIADLNHLVYNAGLLVYIFVASLLFGAVFGYVVAQLIARIEKDLIVETTLTVALAISSFILAEHVFHLSGVISTTATGLIIGNIGRTKISSNTITFINEFWEYVSFLAISLVFFFAAFDVDFGSMLRDPLPLVVAIGAVFVGRAVSVYTSSWLSNRLPMFKNEPNVPLSWQHILSWGGCMGTVTKTFGRIGGLNWCEKENCSF